MSKKDQLYFFFLAVLVTIWLTNHSTSQEKEDKKYTLEKIDIENNTPVPSTTPAEEASGGYDHWESSIIPIETEKPQVK